MPLVVIVDDQVINQQIFARIAAAIEEGVRVRTFGDPGSALEWVSRNTPDLIVTDYKMPVMNGATFIRRLRADPVLTDVPVIVVTVFEDRAFRLKALDAGASDFLHSPVDHREFLTRARNLLKMRRQQQMLASRADSLERSLEQAIRDSSERLAQVIDTVPAMISATDRDGRLLFLNAYQAELFGTDKTRGIDVDLAMCLGEEEGARSRLLDRLVIERGEPMRDFEEEITDRTGVRRVFLTSKSPLSSPEGETVGVLTSAIDITDRKAAERHLHYIAHHDPLTELPNRALLCERLRREVVRSRRGDRRFALHLIDLDGFKDVNDVLGHSVGDAFLIAIASRLRALEKEGHMVARLGGDEFAVLQFDITDPEAASQLAARLNILLAEPSVVAGHRLSSTASIGTVVHPVDGDDGDELLRNADLAMYQAKRTGGNQNRFFAADMKVRAQRDAGLDAELRDALDREEFILHYQPQISLASDEVIGVEALLRWRRADGEIIAPSRFLPRAEENGLIVPINEWVLQEACRQAVIWRREGLGVLRMAVNLSPVQFQRRSLPLLVARLLAETGLEPHMLDLELTETIVMQDTEGVAAQLRQLRELGVCISIDDFGTGFSSLNYVKQFPVDRLKIDQSFVRDLITQPSDAAIVKTIINLGHALNLKVVAEGVETAQHHSYLKNQGCDEAQGYHFAKPMPAESLVEFLGKRPLALAASQ